MSNIVERNSTNIADAVPATDNSSSRILYRQAIEALRNGVPNRTAATLQNPNQPGIVDSFNDMLNSIKYPEGRRSYTQGLLISGGFGVGKSHLLAHLENIAISGEFICSRVPVSKETPLFDLGKVFIEAVENANLPNKKGRLIEELVPSEEHRTESWERFRNWVEQSTTKGVLHPIFLASLVLYEKNTDPEVKSDIEAFWSGQPVKVSQIRAGLRQINELRNHRFKAPKAAELPPQRLQFMVELIKGCGYAGWVVLLDELELIGQYTILQRGRSYAEVARWMGKVPGEAYAGLVAVGAVSDDFADYIISPQGTKKDSDYIGPKLKGNPRYSGIVSRAILGMNILEDECMPLKEPSEDTVHATIANLRLIYTQAYRWEAPQLEIPLGGDALQRRMRYRIRRAINTWDLLRLRPGTNIEFNVTPYTPDYTENSDLVTEKDASAD